MRPSSNQLLTDRLLSQPITANQQQSISYHWYHAALDGYANMSLRKRGNRRRINLDSQDFVGDEDDGDEDEDAPRDYEEYDDESNDTTFKPTKENHSSSDGQCSCRSTFWRHRLLFHVSPVLYSSLRYSQGSRQALRLRRKVTALPGVQHQLLIHPLTQLPHDQLARQAEEILPLSDRKSVV